MKTTPRRILSLGCSVGWLLTAAAQPTPAPDNESTAPEAPAPIVETAPAPELPAQPPPAEVAPAAPDYGPGGGMVVEIPALPELATEPAAAPESALSATPTAVKAPAPAAPAKAAPSPARAPAVSAVSPAPVQPVADGEKGLRLNFRGAPLEQVLNYLSEAAGFIIDLQTEVRGKVDVWSNQPLTKDEAVDVVNSVLNRNGYAAIRNGRTLTIVTRDEAKRRNIPVIRESNPALIPTTDEIVTQIVPVRFINATQLTKDLAPLMPTQTTITANEGGNALVITDTQANIHRLAEIVRALDTSVSSVSTIRVFPLKYADAKALAVVVKELFQTADTSSQRGGNAMQQMFRRFGGGGEAGGAAESAGGGRVASPKVVATSDERSNALVVSAPAEQIPIIEELVKQVDTNVEDVTELRVFHLQHADPQETADLLTSLFPSTTSNNQNNRNQFRFGGPQGSSTTPSDRVMKETRVLAVPDPRTQSVVVSAARDLMTEIGRVVEALDSDASKKKKVFVYDVENTDPQTMQTIIQDLFPAPTGSTSSRSSQNSRTVGNQLNNRTTTTTSSQSSRSTLGSSSSRTGR